ncbi:MAG: Lrp/AsnC family transcriptional regulator [Halobacteriales archaeon]|nr:Lrp/AsnC family transcriptional regulator [Halobacteriales archaeon]
MDELDLRILGSLAWKPGDPTHMARGILRPWDIARSLGVHGNTVKTRLEEMRAAGVLMGVFLVPVARFGSVTESGMFWFEFEGPREKNAAFEALKGRSDINDVHTYVGGTLRVAVLARHGEPLEQAGQRVGQAIGARETRLFYRRVGSRATVDAGPRRLTPLDLRIMMAMVNDAHRPFAEVAEEVGVTQKTVRSRFSAMLRAPVFAIIPGTDLGKVRDLLAFELAVEFDEPEPASTAAFIARFPEAFQRAAHSAENVYLFLAARDTRQVEDYLLRAQSFPGVRRARALLVRETWTNNENILRVLRERLAELEAEGLPA